MGKILKRDTNGVKGLLETGEFGYDNYPAGGDAGRVYVGTGTENLALAKKTEVDAKLDATANAVTATKLKTARTINGVAFDGSANITVEDTTKVAKTSDTGSAKLPVGTTAQRDAVPVEGMIRYNSTTLGFEGYSSGMWQPVGGGQMLGQSLIKAVSYNAQTISENITVPAGLNAYSVGDVTLADGYTLTIENGSVYKIL